MRSLGQDFILGLVEDAIHSVGPARREQLLERLKEKFRDEEIAKAALRVVDPNFPLLRLWAWISGVPMSRQELADLGQTHDLTETEAARLADTICLFGSLLRELKGKTLVLVLDEMERLRSIGPETIPTFESGFTRLMDPNQKSVSILVGASAALQSEMVDIFRENGPVTSRLGADAQIEIPSLDDADVNKFIKGVIQYVRDPTSDVQRLVEDARNSTSETVAEAYFPFTEEAVDAIKSHLTTSMTPRDITLKMTRGLGRAHRATRPLITSDMIS